MSFIWPFTPPSACSEAGFLFGGDDGTVTIFFYSYFIQAQLSKGCWNVFFSQTHRGYFFMNKMRRLVMVASLVLHPVLSLALGGTVQYPDGSPASAAFL